ncbi:MAG: hemerythrin domain-containing protein [Planctomycetota bacterium]|nr:hemerythrin domain-containing protein [Planctomycetota bacterium]
MHNNQLHHDTHDTHEMHDEHEHLREILQEIEQALAERQARPSIIAGFVDDFSSHVLAHFEHEESDGYFAEITAAAPRLNGQVEQLRAQHDRFRELLDVMRQLARQGNGSDAWWCEMEVYFRDFTRAFVAHEHAENNLFQEAYDRDIGEND